MTDVPGRIDVVDVFRRAEHLPGVAREAVARDDVAVVWNQLGLRSAEAREIVASAGRGYVEDRCLEVDAARAGARPPDGPRLDVDVLLLDLDGTVLDHVAAERAALAATFAELGIDHDDAHLTFAEVNADAWRRYSAGEVDEVGLRQGRWAQVGARLDVELDPEAASTSYVRELSAGGHLLPGAAGALWWLGRRARLAAVTDGFCHVQRARLRAAGVADAFAVVRCADEVGAAKPDPAVLRQALHDVGGAPLDRVAMVGDSPMADVGGAQALGVTSVWIAPRDASWPAQLPPPDHRVERLADLA